MLKRRALVGTAKLAARNVIVRSLWSEKVDCVVIGAGVVGLSIARDLAVNHHRDVTVIESASTFGTSTSSRNSQVIHSGIYYPPTSLKSQLCVNGRDLLSHYCKDHNVPFNLIGKLIVSTGSQSDRAKLHHLHRTGTENGVPGLRLISGPQAMAMEPELDCSQALYSPCSGIVDAHSFMLSLIGECESSGRTTFCYNHYVIGAELGDHSDVHLHVSETFVKPDFTLVPKLVVNAAGLSAIPLAERFLFSKKELIPKAYYARGSYFTLSNTKVSPFSHLIYPIPEDGGLGVHATLDLDGRLMFGPDVEWLDDVDYVTSLLNKFDYDVCPSRVERFYPEIRKYYPNLKDGSLQEGYTGIRPKLSGPGQTPADFVIQGEEVHGVAGVVHLFGIESPGLTSSMAIAEYVSARYLKS